MAANALHAQYGWLNWNIADTLTAGPLDSMVLSWPRLFNLDITLFSARLTGAMLTTGCVALIFGAAIRWLPVPAAVVATVPFFLFVGTTTHPDFIHYSSEQLPIFLIALGCYTVAKSYEGATLPWLAASAFALGSVPFAKLQAGPIAGLIGVSTLGYV